MVVQRAGCSDRLSKQLSRVAHLRNKPLRTPDGRGRRALLAPATVATDFPRHLAVAAADPFGARNARVHSRNAESAASGGQRHRVGIRSSL